MPARVLSVVMLVAACAATSLAQQPPQEPKPLITNPKPIKTIKVPPYNPGVLECEPGWTLVVLPGGDYKCARELREPMQR